MENFKKEAAGRIKNTFDRPGFNL